jgi:hypothetical protein
MTSHRIGNPLVIDLEAPLSGPATILERVLADFGLLETFRSRPVHQQEGYLWLISSAGRPAIRDERIADLLDELAGLRFTDFTSDVVDFAVPRSTHRQEG